MCVKDVQAVVFKKAGFSEPRVLTAVCCYSQRVGFKECRVLFVHACCTKTGAATRRNLNACCMNVMLLCCCRHGPGGAHAVQSHCILLMPLSVVTSTTCVCVARPQHASTMLAAMLACAWHSVVLRMRSCQSPPVVQCCSVKAPAT